MTDQKQSGATTSPCIYYFIISATSVWAALAHLVACHGPHF